MRTKMITTSLDEDNRAIARVPLGKNGGKGIAIIYLEDFERLVSEGLSASWNLLPKGYVIASCATSSGHSVQVARVLLDAGPGEVVKYVNDNRKDLRSNNLVKFTTGSAAKRRDREYLKSTSRQTKPNYISEVTQ